MPRTGPRPGMPRSARRTFAPTTRSDHPVPSGRRSTAVMRRSQAKRLTTGRSPSARPRDHPARRRRPAAVRRPGQRLRPHRVARRAARELRCPIRASSLRSGEQHGNDRSRDQDPSAGARPAPPVAALQPHGRVRRPARDPDHRPRRRLLRLGRARQPLPRRPQRAVLRQHRPRPPGRRPGAAPTRPASWASSRTGPTRIRGRSSSPRGSPRSPPATSTACSSPAAARRRSSRR